MIRFSATLIRGSWNHFISELTSTDNESKKKINTNVSDYYFLVKELVTIIGLCFFVHIIINRKEKDRKITSLETTRYRE
jgi:uncharacterized membrane protein